MTDRLELPLRYRDQLEALLREHVPGVEVWAYGSRVNGESHDGSDLDLVLRSPTLEPLGEGFHDLLEAIEKSSIPFLIQAHDWTRLSESFHREIERDSVVVQERAQRTTVGDFDLAPVGDVTSVRSGFAFKSSDWTDSGVPVVKIGNVKDGNLAMDGCSFVSQGVAAVAADFNLKAGDILIALTGYIGEVAMVRSRDLPVVLNQRVGLFSIRDQSRLDQQFLFYALRNLEVREQIQGLGYGSAQPNVSPSLVGTVGIPLPSLREQRAIAHILGTLDDKIELNRRMNETLEEMARALFKSWFVDFDPVRVKVQGRWRDGESLPGLPAEYYDLFPDRLVDSELGEIPEGWEIRPLGDFIEISSGGTPRTSVSDYWDGDIPWYTAKDAPALSDVFVLAAERSITQAGVDNSSTKVLPVGTTIITARGTVGRLACLGIPMAMNQTCYGIRGVEGYPDFFTYWNVRNTVSELQARTHGTIFDTITRETFRIAEAVQAATEVSRAFEYAVSPLMRRILSNLNESRTLTAQRDALLPKLLAGAVRVESTQTQGAARPEIESSRDMAGDDRRKVLY